MGKVKEEFPEYARIGGIEVKYVGDGYYHRTAGLWEVHTKFKDGKHIVATRHSKLTHLNEAEVIPITEEEWREGNAGYVDTPLGDVGYFTREK